MSFLPPVPDAPPRSFQDIIKNHPGLEPRAVKNIKSTIRQYRNRAPTPPKIVSGSIVNPNNLKPIHLRSGPLRPLSPTTEHFAVRYGASNIVNRRKADLASHVQDFPSQDQSEPPRKKHKFIDDSAIESDGEGGDIQSTTTSPPNSPPPSPQRTEENLSESVPTLSSPTNEGQNVISSKKKIRRAVPNSTCALCGVFASGPHQLEQHLKSKNHKKRARRIELPNSTLYCSTCNYSFDNFHNFNNHKC